MPRTIIDITRPLGPAAPVWPGDEPFSLTWTRAPGRGAVAVSSLRFSPHTGTHLDAPLHLDGSGGDVAGVPLAACVGPCQVVAARGPSRPISRHDLPPTWAPSEERVLFATGTWPAGTAIPAAFASLESDLVELLAAAGVVLVGVDTPSVDDPAASALPSHRLCVSRGIAILEGLDLTGASEGVYTLVAAPLRLEGVEASPVRAFLLGAG